MTQEEKSLLLQDLCARLPYRVICTDSRHGDSTITEIDIVEKTVYCYDFDEYVELDKCKPYLRPMSSITKEEKEEFEQIRYNAEAKLFNAFSKGGFTLAFHEIDDWLNAHHFDYRGLIPMKLALEAPEGMYNIKEQ